MILLVVIMVFFLFIFIEDKIISDNKETFEQCKRSETISKAFNMLLLREPYEYEKEEMEKVMQNDYDIDSVINVITQTNEFKSITDKKSLHDRAKSVEEKAIYKKLVDMQVDDINLPHRMDLYRIIVLTYQTILERMPNETELKTYMYNFHNDKTFTAEKLANILQSSKEREMLSNVQSNTLNFELPGNYTDAQLTMEILEVYNSIFQEDPSKDVENFLKLKYKEYQLNKKRLTSLILMIKTMEDNFHSDDSTRYNKKPVSLHSVIEEDSYTKQPTIYHHINPDIENILKVSTDTKEMYKTLNDTNDMYDSLSYVHMQREGDNVYNLNNIISQVA